MAEKVLISIESRYIKSIVLKSLFERNFDFVEVLDANDLMLKLDIFRESILFYIIEIDSRQYEGQYKLIKKLKTDTGMSGFSILAIIHDGTAEIVGGAKDAKIDDVFLIPEKRELLRSSFNNRLSQFLKKFPSTIVNNPEWIEYRKNIVSAFSEDEDLKHEIKRAGRGKYPVSFIMGRVFGARPEMIQDLYNKLKSVLRDTDRIMNYDSRTFVIVCPFTPKENLVLVENKIRGTYEQLFGRNTVFRRLDMYGATYPDDGRSIDKLIELCEKGVHDSIVISGILEPLNTLSRERLEEYKRMLRLYKE
ncbi:MAG: hypothetical protein QM315_03495 [Bacillota bacterium]|nr:hypothetical protein [Bacillota bacterium]